MEHYTSCTTIYNSQKKKKKINIELFVVFIDFEIHKS